MKLRHAAARRLLVYTAIFAFLGAVFGGVTFLAGVGLSGMQYVPRGYLILNHIFCWPDLIVALVLREDQIQSLYDDWLIYWVGLPMLGWALLGAALSSIHSLISKSESQP
ncbi:MAG TPA: hypothetical protein VIX59_05540 [Candidatus Binataceae bacterium]